MWKLGEITLFYAVKANKTGLAEDLRLRKIPRNVVTNYFKEKLLKRKNYRKVFWNFGKPYFTNQGIWNSEPIFLEENEQMLTKDPEITKTFSNYFYNIPGKLRICNWVEGAL